MDATLRAELRKEFFEGVTLHLRQQITPLMSTLSTSLTFDSPQATLKAVEALKVNRERLEVALNAL